MASKKQPVKSPRLAAFVQHLADDPAFRARFKKDPKGAMDEHNLGKAQRKAVQAGQSAVRKLLTPGTSAAMSMISGGDGGGGGSGGGGDGGDGGGGGSGGRGGGGGKGGGGKRGRG